MITLQYIIVAIVVGATVLWALWWIYKTAKGKKEGEGGCPGCSACSSKRHSSPSKELMEKAREEAKKKKS